MKKKVLSLLLASAMVVSMAACGGNDDTADNSTPVSQGSDESGSQQTDNSDPAGAEESAEPSYTYREYVAVSPSNWNELTYKDNNDTEIMTYIGSNFFIYDFAYDSAGEIIPGDFEMQFSAATALEDISDQVDAKWNVPEGGKGYAYKITLRDDLKWDDGTPITAEDFVYTMQQQLDPLFQNYRADSYYNGATIIVNARNYLMQGQSEAGIDNGSAGTYTVADLVKGDDGVYTQPDGGMIKFALEEPLEQGSGYTVTELTDMGYLDTDAFAALQALADENGRVDITDETIDLVTKLIDTEDWGNEPPENVPLYMVYDYTYPETDFSDVGIFVGDNAYELILVLAKSLPLLKDDGSLSYQAAYNMSSLPLVKKDLYEQCKIAPSEGSSLWTTNYNSSVETTASWGPYKLESFQGGKQFTLVRNENWFGYNDPMYAGQYQTTRIVCDTIDEWNAAWLKFLAGELDGIGIDVSIADEYKGSDRAYFTPDDFVGSMQLQSSVEQLKARESAGVNKSLLGYADFRKAISLAIDRNDFAAKTTTSSLAGFGLFNSMHYYDVENGGAYRNTDEAKQVLCDVYAVDVNNYASLDEAADAITGYNLEEARALLTKAYNDALAAGDIKEGDKVVLTFGSGVINEVVQRRCDYIGNALQELAKTTPLEGKIEVELKDYAEKWADDFRAGAYDICMGGWTGAAWDPGYFLAAYLSPANMYSMAWDTSSQMMTFTMKGVGENGADVTETMSL
ncbi:MAG: ABC transporter substrate-binding protein, partial [Butyrivibrio sp.]|nr:ABC transporter substrate-binding protein [Butyrivibrio sp.]